MVEDAQKLNLFFMTLPVLFACSPDETIWNIFDAVSIQGGNAVVCALTSRTDVINSHRSPGTE